MAGNKNRAGHRLGHPSLVAAANSWKKHSWKKRLEIGSKLMTLFGAHLSPNVDDALNAGADRRAKGGAHGAAPAQGRAPAECRRDHGIPAVHVAATRSGELANPFHPCCTFCCTFCCTCCCCTCRGHRRWCRWCPAAQRSFPRPVKTAVVSQTAASTAV